MGRPQLLAWLAYGILKRLLGFAFFTMQCYVYDVAAPAEMAETRFACLAPLGNLKFAQLIYAKTAVLHYRQVGALEPAGDHQYTFT